MRQIVLDTETTGLEPSQGHRIIEIGCVELVNRKLTGRHYHQYIQPDRLVDEGAMEVHGITDEFLKDKPRFAQIAPEFLEFINGAQLVIHNAPFDIGFIDHEFAMLRPVVQPVSEFCSVIDTLVMARQKHPGQKNNLDALCKRYGVDNSQRDLHGALLDAEILADVYLLMTGGQTKLMLGAESEDSDSDSEYVSGIQRVSASRAPLRVIRANSDELSAHEAKLNELGESCLWRQS
ncbi:DNA polymerase III subunit epsilon [Aestuariicella sp. G3-2]|uniref:DNA polymerase III subunit epsilon n=1 Tax=Pseudomaricurvus albidus TaxID=2842452 RepID=UPI001C0C9C4C|nr:DNA polymerase III subunit epsilon [Aestuariicella albida]MBU3070092.1 DNA polymerase III subunit epsilon [Aestuariicella albida]